MNRTSKALCLCTGLICAGALMSFTSSNPTSQCPIPEPVEGKIIQMAVSHRVISESEGAILTDYHAVQQCVDAFINNGYKPSAAVDKLAEISVAGGKFSSEAEAKRAIKKTIEKARKKESNWRKAYKLLGL